MVKAATLEFEFVAEIARLEQGLRQIKQGVNQTMREAVREHQKAEAAAERYAAALEKEAAAIGKTARQIKQMEIAANAAAAEQAGFVDLAQRIRLAGKAYEDMGQSAKKGGGLARHELLNTSYQLQDMIIGIQGGQKLSTVFLQQGSQLIQIAAASEAGILGMARSIAGLALRFAPLGVAIGLVVGGLSQLSRWMNEDSGLKKYADGLGLTHKEMKKLGDTSVTVGDTIKGLWKTISDTTPVDEAIRYVGNLVTTFTKNFWDTIVGLTGGLYTFVIGTYQGFMATWDKLPAAFADLFIRAVNAAIDRLNALGKAANKFLGVDAFGQVEKMKNDYAGAAKQVGDAWTKAFRETRAQWNSGTSSFMQQWRQNSVQAAQDRLSAKAAEIIADRTEKKSKADKEAEKAARELAQTYDQIISKLDPMTNATKEYEETVAKIDKLLKAGLLGKGQLGEQYAEQLKQAAREIQMKARDQWVEMKFEPFTIDTSKLTAGLNLIADHFALVNHLGRSVADRWAEIAANVRDAASGLGSFGAGFSALVDGVARYQAAMDRANEVREKGLKAAMTDAGARSEVEQKYARESARAQVALYGDITGSAKQFFKEGSAGYKALATAEKTFRAIQLALSIRAMAQDAAETATSVANSVIRTGKKAVEAVVSAISSLPFPLNLAAGAATIAALASIGVSIAGAFGGSGSRAPTNQGTGTVFGDSDAKSDSIKRSIDLLGDLEGEMLVFTRQMAASLKNIESSIGGLTNLVIRLGGEDGIGANAAAGVKTGFKSDALGNILQSSVDFFGIAKVVPILGDILGGIGSILGSLFGTKTKVVGAGIFGGPQTLGAIDSIGFQGQSFADIQKKKKFFGVTTSTKYSTQYGELDAAIEDQFGKLLLSFADAIKLAAGPLGLSLDDVEKKLDSFVVDIGKIDLKDLSGDEIQEKLTAVFGAQADKMAQYVMGGLEKYQQVGEGYFETLVRVASTVDLVTTSLQQLGLSAQSLGIDASMAIANLFGGAEEYATAASAYFEAFYTEAEQAAAKTAQLAKVFDSLGVAMPDSIAAYRALVDAQDLTTEAGQKLYAQLIQLGPAFAEIISSGQSSSSAAAILRERQDLEQRILELEGNTAALRERELAQLDPSNRALQQRIYALQDEAEAAQRAAAIVDERAGLEKQILQLQGDTAAIRAQELAALDPSNRALQERIYALQDEAAAAAEVARVAGERDGLLRQLYELQGDTTKLRQMELAALDPSNRALQMQIYALQDQQKAAQEAADTARELADAWGSVGDSIMDEVKRIRGLNTTNGAGSYQTLAAQFAAATNAARGGDMDAAKSLPGLSQALLEAAANQVGTRQELEMIQRQTAGSLEQTYRTTEKMVSQQEAAAKKAEQAFQVALDQQALWETYVDQQATAASDAQAASDSMIEQLQTLGEQVATLIDDQRTVGATLAANTGKTAKILDNVSSGSGGNALTVNVDGTVNVSGHVTTEAA